ncbi:DUF1552 domain-containing protein [Rubinisphaera sp. JC750]|uniref:DUF1552 domain-containing protein n=1 Tax=Rubinisphaera sp. JC750 TaxID=2898658 RepID=UPI001F3A90B6|nr:DUF1552 domain-containing protein [Rubinisphaera sp. JC750]
MFKPISRRAMLQGTGAALALPWLEAMSPRAIGAESLSKPPVRTAFLFVPNGVWPKSWTPEGKDEQYEITPLLEPLAEHQSEFLLLENLWNEKTAGRNGHWPKVPAFLSGGFVVRTAGRDMDTGGISCDQQIAKALGHQTALPSLELGVDEPYTGVDNVGGGFTRIYGSHIAWRDPHTPVPKEILPQLAFDRLFRNGPATPLVSGLDPRRAKVVESVQRDRVSVLDLVMEHANSVKRQVSTNDRTKIDEYMESVRDLERRIEAASKPQPRWVNEQRFDLKRPAAGIPDDHQEHVRLMLDILVLAFWTDTTRVGTFMFGNAQTGRNFSFLDGVKSSFHSISHHREEDAKLAEYQNIVKWHVGEFAYLLDRMRSLKETDDSTLLDNSMLLYGSTIKDGNRHTHEDLPLILAGRGGGAIRTGRRLIAPKQTPLCNLFLTMMDNLGVSLPHFGDSTGRLQGLA